MAENSKIEWTTHTANLWHGCTKVHEGCDHCYAETLSHRWGRDIWGNDKPRMEIKSVWNDLARYQRDAAAAGEMARVFVGSMMDIAEKDMPLIDSKGNSILGMTTDHLRQQLFESIRRGIYPNLIFLFLSKRPSNYNKIIPASWKINPPENVMFGTSPVNQVTADKLIPQLLEVNGKHFLSIEPMLGPVDLGLDQLFYESAQKIDWVICGGESGHGARPMHPEWVISIRDQCADARVPFFFKQWGEYVSAEQASGAGYEKIDDGMSLSLPGYYRVGKKAAGRVLDGNVHDGIPVFFNNPTPVK